MTDKLEDNMIKITEYNENEDGSATLQIELSDFVKNVLLELGFISLVEKHIEDLEHTEHLKK